jgi:ZIP family zinc transporter
VLKSCTTKSHATLEGYENPGLQLTILSFLNHLRSTSVSFIQRQLTSKTNTQELLAQSMTAADGHSVAIAFALCFGAGFATVLGGMVVFSKRLVHLANPVSLAIALSVSGGVMIFISLVEIFGKSVELLTLGLKSEDMSESTAHGHGWLLATVFFGVGILLIYAIDFIVHKISPETHELTELDNIQDFIPSMINHENNINDEDKSAIYVEAQTPTTEAAKMAEITRQRLVRMGLLSALALGIHNIPEGIATYVGAIEDSSVGISLAIGIGLHNIPEGIAVAAPIYFATGSRWKGIMWCAISAIAEPFGGFLAWLTIGDGMDPVTEGILFGIVCGIMVCICVKELWPTAYKFAGGKTHYVAFGTFAGMFIMVTSLILFGYAGV